MAIIPGNEQNLYSHTDLEILNMDGQSNTIIGSLPEMPASDFLGFLYHAIAPFLPI